MDPTQMLMALIVAIAHETVANDEVWAAFLASQGKQDDPARREELHDIIDVVGAAIVTTPAPPASPFEAQPAGWFN